MEIESDELAQSFPLAITPPQKEQKFLKTPDCTPLQTSVSEPDSERERGKPLPRKSSHLSMSPL